jgi:hypothetical protein
MSSKKESSEEKASNAKSSEEKASNARGGVTAKLYKGMPTVELKDNDKISVNLELNETLSKEITESAKKGAISISLDNLDLDLQHNQSFGMVSASTGCVSNPGGPSC